MEVKKELEEYGYENIACFPDIYDDAFIGVDMVTSERIAYDRKKLDEISENWLKDYEDLKTQCQSDDRYEPWIVDTEEDCTGMKSLANMDDYIFGCVDNHKIAYLYDMLVAGFMEVENMTLDEAEEWISYNTLRALPYEGEGAPVVLMTFENYI